MCGRRESCGWERCARCVAGRHDQHHLHHHVLRVRPRPCTLSSSIGLTECHVSFRLCTFVCLQSLTLSHKLSLTRSLGPQRHSTRTLLPCRDVLVEKHYRSVLGRGVLDPFFAAHTKVCTFTCSLPTRLSCLERNLSPPPALSHTSSASPSPLTQRPSSLSLVL